MHLDSSYRFRASPPSAWRGRSKKYGDSEGEEDAEGLPASLKEAIAQSKTRIEELENDEFIDI